MYAQQFSFIYSIHSTASASSSNEPKHVAHSSLETSRYYIPVSWLSSTFLSNLCRLLLDPSDDLCTCPPLLLSFFLFLSLFCLSFLCLKFLFFSSSLTAFFNSLFFLLFFLLCTCQHPGTTFGLINLLRWSWIHKKFCHAEVTFQQDLAMLIFNTIHFHILIILKIIKLCFATTNNLCTVMVTDLTTTNL